MPPAGEITKQTLEQTAGKTVSENREDLKSQRKSLDPNGDFDQFTQLLPETGIWDVDDTVNPKPPRDTDLWVQVAGAAWGQRAAPEGTPTPHEADLYTVRFRNSKDGFAAGSTCKDPVDPNQG